MHPVLFDVPGLNLPIRSFGVTVAIGILVGIWIWGKLLERYGADPEKDPARASQAALWAVIGVLVGARLMYVGVESTRYLATDVTPAMRSYLESTPENRSAAIAQMSPEEHERARSVAVGHDFLSDPFKVFLIWQGGLVMYGGLIGGILFGALSARKHGLSVWNGLDTALVGAFTGLAIGRWGCLLVGDDHGSVVSAAQSSFPMIGLPNGGAIGPLTIRVPTGEWLATHTDSLFGAELAGQVLWATQPWMSINALAVAGLGYLVLKRRTWWGQAATCMLLHYAVTRFLIEFFRGDDIRGVWFGGALSTSQLVSIVGAIAALVVLVKKPGPPLRAQASPQA